MKSLTALIEPKYTDTVKHMAIYILAGITLSVVIGSESIVANTSWQSYLLILSGAMASGLFFLSLKINLEKPNLDTKVISLISISLTAILYKNYFISMDSDINLVGSFAWQATITAIFYLSICFFITKTLTNDIALTKQVTIIAATALIIVIVNASITNKGGQNDTPQQSVQLISMIIALLVPLASYLWSLNTKARELSLKPNMQSLKLILHFIWTRKENIKVGILFILPTTITAAIYINEFMNESSLITHTFSYILFIIPLAVLIFQNSIKGVQNTKLQKRVYSFTNNSEKKFLNRHLDQDQIQAINSSSKTCNFSINHDPDHKLSSILPKTLQYIRTKEIEKCIQTTAEDKFLSCQEKGHSFTGSIDPETSLRPCVDALLMFAAIHLDAVTRVEKRLLGLLDLLPVLDPQLVEGLPRNFDETLKNQSPWLYQLDHNWVDQQMIHTDYESSYSISQGLDAHISPEDIKTLLKNKGIQASTFIWVNAQARARILLEAPMLHPIIQDHFLQNGKGDDSLVFLIKLEDLIPRLQKFYDLDKIRSRLQDFEPSSDSMRFIQLLELQLVNDANLDNIQKLLLHISEYPWHGFKEKDLALQVIKKCYVQALSVINTQTNDEGSLQLKEKLHKATFLATTQVGYPSELLHKAQIEKWAVRNKQKLLQYASKIKSQRHHEAWVMLATCEIEHLSVDEGKDYLHFLEAVPSNKQLNRSHFILNKSIQSITNLLQTDKFSDAVMVKNLLSKYSVWLVEAHANIDTCILFLDSWAVLNKRFSLALDLSDEHKGRLNHYFASLCENSQTTQNQAHSLFYRWTNLDTPQTQISKIAS